MLSCTIDLNNFQRTCGACKKCTSISKGAYFFNKDLKNSEQLVDELEKLVERGTPYHCADTTIHKNPDILVYDTDSKLVCRIEAKMLEDKPFMKVHDFLPGHDLFPKETIVVDKPKLESYIARWKKDGGIPTYVVWHLGRPCADVGGITIFQDISVLYDIFQQQGEKRVFTRRTGIGDIKDGKKLGITEKYHFSISECRPIYELCNDICNL